MAFSLEITQFGGPEVLKWKETKTLPLFPHGVRIRVGAAGINFADIMMRMGLYPEAPRPPFVPGYEIAGTILEVGSSVRSLQIGDRVLAGTRFGGYTTEIVLPEILVRKIPGSLSDVEAASIPVNFLTAWVALQEMGRVKKGDRVLVQNAAGGVGIAAVQIAVQAGAFVVGTVGSSAKVAPVQALGAAEVITQSEWESLSDSDRGGFQIALDSAGGSNLKKTFRRLAPGGRVITLGMSSVVSGPKRSLIKIASALIQTAFFTPFKLMMENKGVFGLNMLQFFPNGGTEKSHLMLQSLDFILERFEDKSFQTVVGKVFPLPQGGEAQQYLQSRANIGKIILVNSET